MVNVDTAALRAAADATTAVNAELADNGGVIQANLDASRQVAAVFVGWSTGGGMAGAVDKWRDKLPAFTGELTSFANALTGSANLYDTTDHTNSNLFGGGS